MGTNDWQNTKYIWWWVVVAEASTCGIIDPRTGVWASFMGFEYEIYDFDAKKKKKTRQRGFRKQGDKLTSGIKLA